MGHNLPLRGSWRRWQSSASRIGGRLTIIRKASCIEQFHRSLKEEEVWTSEYRSLPEARENIGRYLEEYNHDRPYRDVENRTPLEASLAFAVLTKNQALNG
jgi:transposase InsO family protein